MALAPVPLTLGQRFLEFLRGPSWQALMVALGLRPRHGPGVVVLATADGRLHIGRFVIRPASAARALEIVMSVASEGKGRPEFSLPSVQLSPDESQFVAAEIETVRDATDFRITLFAVATGVAQFSPTDNSRPDVIFRGDDPASPPEVLAEQAISDRYWEEDRIDRPDLPRAIVEGRFAEEYGFATIGVAGWTAAAEVVVSGECPIVVDRASSGRGYPWWGLVAPVAGARWQFVSRAAGALPATVVIRATPAPVRRLARGLPLGDGFQLLVDGVAQTAPALGVGVVSFDGPFTR